MRNILFLLALFSCSPKSALILEDLIDGEVKVVEHIVEDAGGIPHPQHDVQVSKK